MALPFLAGLILGGGAVIAYNNRDKISKALQNATQDIQENVKQANKRGTKALQSLATQSQTQPTKTKKSANKAKATTKKPRRTKKASTAPVAPTSV